MDHVTHVMVGVACPRCQGRKTEINEWKECQNCPSCAGDGYLPKAIKLEEFVKRFEWYREHVYEETDVVGIHREIGVRNVIRVTPGTSTEPDTKGTER
jgi:hypothetical protein